MSGTINGRPNIAGPRVVFLAADQTFADTTLTAITGLSQQVKNGKKYVFELILMCEDSIAADGVKWDFNAGTATMTNFRAQGAAFDTLAALLPAQVTALNTAQTIAVLTGASRIDVRGSIEPSSDGTFAVMAAQNAHTTGTLTISRGSHLILWEVGV